MSLRSNFRPIATRCTQRQLAYLAYWQSLGYQFSSDAVIPEDTCVVPDDWRMPSRLELIATAACLAVIFAAAWIAA